jgi:acylphosphatase
MNTKANARIHLVITGRVQGVWYRASAQEQAQTLGLSGWVRNQANGDVEVVAEGPRSALEALLEWCGNGPPMAHVGNVQVRWEEPLEETQDFHIRY